jgi:TrkA domain protein
MGHGVKVHDLPGIGQRFDIDLGRTDQRVSVITRGDDRRDLYVFTSNSPEPSAVLELTDEQARKLAAVLAGMYYG